MDEVHGFATDVCIFPGYKTACDGFLVRLMCLMCAIRVELLIIDDLAGQRAASL